MYQKLFTRVLVGWDGSTGAAAALRLGLRLTAVDGGRVTAVAVVPSYAHVEDAEERDQAEAEVRATVRDPYEAVLAEQELHTGQQAALEFIEADDVARVLDEYARTHLLDLVVVGLHGREGLLHPRMGHIASHAVQMSHCPVLVVPEPGREAVVAPTTPASALFHPFRHRAARS